MYVGENKDMTVDHLIKNKLEPLVNDKIKEGYIPVGGVSVAVVMNFSTVTQAMMLDPAAVSQTPIISDSSSQEFKAMNDGSKIVEYDNVGYGKGGKRTRKHSQHKRSQYKHKRSQHKRSQHKRSQHKRSQHKRSQYKRSQYKRSHKTRKY